MCLGNRFYMVDNDHSIDRGQGNKQLFHVLWDLDNGGILAGYVCDECTQMTKVVLSWDVHCY